MNYNIHIAPIIEGEMIGVEIQPPVSDKVFDGIRAMLIHELHGPIAPNPATVELTRNDAEGTAFVFSRNFDADGDTVDSPLEIEQIGERVAELIDPATLHEVQTHYPAGS